MRFCQTGYIITIIIIIIIISSSSSNSSILFTLFQPFLCKIMDFNSKQCPVHLPIMVFVCLNTYKISNIIRCCLIMVEFL